MTASKISDAITTTTRQLVETLSSKREVTVFSKSESTEVKEEEATETNTLKNPNNGLVITYVYHHLNALYRVHVDLVDIELIYHTGRSIDRPVVISLNEGVQSGLATLVKDDLLNDCVKRVTSIFQDLYADIQAVRYEGDNAFVNHAESSDVNNDLTTRSILLGDRRTEGELPLNLTSRLELLQTGDLHAVPLVSEYSAAEAKTESNGDSKKVAPKNRTA